MKTKLIKLIYSFFGKSVKMKTKLIFYIFGEFIWLLWIINNIIGVIETYEIITDKSFNNPIIIFIIVLGFLSIIELIEMSYLGGKLIINDLRKRSEKLKIDYPIEKSFSLDISTMIILFGQLLYPLFNYIVTGQPIFEFGLIKYDWIGIVVFIYYFYLLLLIGIVMLIWLIFIRNRRKLKMLEKLKEKIQQSDVSEKSMYLTIYYRLKDESLIKINKLTKIVNGIIVVVPVLPLFF